MAGTTASGKTQEGSPDAPTTVALVANERSGASNPGLCAKRLASFGAEVRRFGIEAVDAAAAAGADRLVIAGGDGSIGPVAAAAGAAGVPLAVIPVGTANDFARRLGLPRELDAACRLAVRGTRLRPLELGWMSAHTDGAGVEERAFVNVASAGLPAPAARRAHSWKERLGPLAYAVGAVHAGLTAKPVTCLVECDGRELLAGEAWQVTVAASGAFGAGASLQEADPGDGDLELVAIEAGPRLALPGLAYRLRTGRVTSHPRAFHARCSEAGVQVPDRTEFNVDGELLTAGDARFRAERGAFRLVVA